MTRGMFAISLGIFPREFEFKGGFSYRFINLRNGGAIYESKLNAAHILFEDLLKYLSEGRIRIL